MRLLQYLESHASEWTKPTVDPKCFNSLKYSTDILPGEYLLFAEKDLRSGGVRGRVNALANSKRAIDCELSSILAALKIQEPWSFPDRLERVQELGLAAPRILKKLSQLRNVLEHRYYNPTLHEVEDAVDVATLFLEAMKPYHAGGMYMEEFWLADNASANSFGDVVRTKTHTIIRNNPHERYTFSRGIFISTESGLGVIELELVHNNESLAILELSPKDKGYIEIQRYMLQTGVNGGGAPFVEGKKFLRLLKDVAS
jgi:hypothetical protein